MDAEQSAMDAKIREILKDNLEWAIEAVGRREKENSGEDVSQEDSILRAFVSSKLGISKEHIGAIENVVRDEEGKYIMVLYKVGIDKGAIINLTANEIKYYSKIEEAPIKVEKIFLSLADAIIEVVSTASETKFISIVKYPSEYKKAPFPFEDSQSGVNIIPIEMPDLI